MRRGEIRWVDFDPTRGAEASKRRPAIVVSNDRVNLTVEQLRRGVVTVVPVTSNVRRVYPFQVRLPAGESGLRTEAKAQAEQVRSVSFERVGAVIGRIAPEVLERLDDALRLHLDL